MPRKKPPATQASQMRLELDPYGRSRDFSGARDV